jgi:hypothetical protein
MWKQFWNSQGKMHMYEYLLFELKSEHVFSMPGFGHVAMEKKYTQYLLFDLKSEWVSQELWHTGRRSTSSSKNSCQGKEGLFSRGQWVQDRLASFGRNTGTYHTLGKAQC